MKHSTTDQTTSRTSGRSRKPLFIGGLLAILAAVLVLVSIGLFREQPDSWTVYIQDGELFLFADSLGEPLQLTDGLWAQMEGNEANVLSNYHSIRYDIHLCSDGSRIFFPGSYYNQEDGSRYTRYFVLCFRDLPAGDTVLIDSDVTDFTVCEDGSTLYYRKGTQDELYIYNAATRESQKIDTGIFTLAYAAPGKAVYRTDAGAACIWTADSGVSTLAHSIDNVVYSPETDTFFLSAEDNSMLVKTPAMDTPEKIADNVCRYVCLQNTGEMYYITKGTDTFPISGYLEDDLAEASLSPEEKQRCEEIRDTLKDRKVVRTVYSLYFFDGSQSTLLSRELAGTDLNVGRDRAVLVYEHYIPRDVPKVKLSEATSIDDTAVEILVNLEDALEGDTAYALAVGPQTEVITETALEFMVSPDGSAVYFLDAPGDDPETATLYQLPVTPEGAGEVRILDTDVNLSFFTTANQPADHIVYSKDADEEAHTGTLCVDGRTITENALGEKYRDMYPLLLQDNDHSGESLAFFTDWDSEKLCGTLCLVDLADSRGKVITVAQNVSYFAFSADSTLCYLQDFSFESNTGTAFRFHIPTGRISRMADGVQVIFDTP